MASSGHLLKKLRSLMVASSAGKLSAYIVPTGDAHQSEYPCQCDLRRQFISKFTGSSGSAIITLDKAALWTDGRYHLQASQELDLTFWTLMKAGLPDTPTQGDWLKDELNPGSKVGADPFLLSHDAWKSLSRELKSRDITLVAVKENLVDLVWEDASVLGSGDSKRPPRPSNKLINLGIGITGKEWTQKVFELRQEMKKKKASSIILTSLDTVAWLLNLRGSDVEYNPVFLAYCIVTMDDVYLFIDEEKLTAEVERSINATTDLSQTPASGEILVRILPYDSVVDFIKTKLVPNESGLVWLCNGSSEALHLCIPKKQKLMLANPANKQKAIKNDVEVQNMKNCHVRDAAALCEYLAWLEKTIEANPDGNENLWEATAAEYLEKCRSQQEHFMGLSFPTISSSGPNGAVIHYRPEKATQRAINKKELYLVDSGGQYLDGTTDVTRTVHFGTPTPKERECFTYVLKGHIQLAKSIFPKLTKANSLDSFARQYLWEQGLDYLHGTGHGVGMFLNVHEGPAAISPRPSPDDPGLEPGWIMSNEPGYYEDGSFGIRIENLVVIEKAETRYKFKQEGSLKFETITLVPIQLKMIDLSLLTDAEVDWLNNYHTTCRSVVGAYLDKLGKQEVKQWLIKETEKVTRS